MKKIFALFFVLTAFVSEAQDRLLGATPSTNIVFVSNTVTNKMWKRDVLMAKGTNLEEIVDKSGQFVSQTTYIDTTNTAAQTYKVANAWKGGFIRATNDFMQSVGAIPTNGITLGLVFPLDTTGRQNLDMYIAASQFDGEYDRFWVYFSKELTTRPNMSVPYINESGFTTNRVTGRWLDWLHDSITTNGYTGCKRLVVKRPAHLRSMLGDLNPHISFGRKDIGFTWGSTVLLVNNRPTFTGQITNNVDGLVMTLFNGSIRTIEPIDSGEEEEEEEEPEEL